MLKIKQSDGPDLVWLTEVYQTGSNTILVFHTRDKYCYTWDCYTDDGNTVIVFQNRDDTDDEYQIFIEVCDKFDAVHFIPMKYEYRVVLIPNIFLPTTDSYDTIPFIVEST